MPPDVTITRQIPAPPDRVFAAWLDPSIARKFFFATATGEMVRAEIDPRVGGKFTMVDRRDGKDFEHVGKFLELDRPRRIVFEFTVKGYGDVGSRISVDIQPSGSGSEVTLTYFDAPPDHAEKARAGWGTILAGLESALS
jgi:uncharacterized protein YndB with AHSA1/START domain